MKITIEKIGNHWVRRIERYGPEFDIPIEEINKQLEATKEDLAG